MQKNNELIKSMSSLERNINFTKLFYASKVKKDVFFKYDVIFTAQKHYIAISLENIY